MTVTDTRDIARKGVARHPEAPPLPVVEVNAPAALTKAQIAAIADLLGVK